MNQIYGKYNYISVSPAVRGINKKPPLFSPVQLSPNENMYINNAKGIMISLSKTVGFFSSPQNNLEAKSSKEESRSFSSQQAALAVGLPERASSQLFYNKGRKNCVAFKGRIYNSNELRERFHLNNRCAFGSEAGIISSLYEKKGMDCLKELNGGFGFVLWDENLETLFLCRDTFGIKPVFYCQSQEGLVFSSDIKSILSGSSVKAELDIDSLNEFLSYGYIPSPDTLFRNIKLLDAGCYLECSKKGPALRRYWDINESRKKTFFQSEKDYIGCFDDLFNKAVDIRARGERPIGILFSGGIDSASIAHSALKSMETKPKLFCGGFKEKEYDQIPLAEVAAGSLGLDIEHIRVNEINADILNKIVFFSERPVADPTIVPSYYISACLSNKGISSILSGLGADELLGGFDTYLADFFYLHYSHYQKLIPGIVKRKFFKVLADKLSGFEYPVSAGFKLKKILAAFASENRGFPGIHCYWREIFSQEEKKMLFSGEFRYLSQKKPYSAYDSYLSGCGHLDLGSVFNADLKMLLPDSSLVIANLMSGICGLEVGMPFLDKDFSEFILALPLSYKMRGITRKYILKRAMEKKLPRDLIRRKKRGFSVPISRWIRRELRDFVLDCLSESRVKKIGYFDEKFVEKLLEEHLKDRKDNSLKIWGLLNFFVWYDVFIEHKPSAY